MFIAIRDLRFARGRFALLGSVVALMTLMVVMLSGLTAGLSATSISALDALPVDHLALQRPAGSGSLSLSTSTLPADAAAAIARVPGVRAAYPLGISTSRLAAGSRTAAVSVIATDTALMPDPVSGSKPAATQVAVTRELADGQSLAIGDTVTLGTQTLTISAVIPDASLSHLPVAYLPIDTWQAATHTEGLTAVAVRLGDADPSQAAAAIGATVVTLDQAHAAVTGYAEEQGSLNLIRGLLLGISALIIGAFFAVWTMQRGHDLAVVRAIGGGRSYLLRDAIGQAALVLAAGAVLGAALAALLGALAARVVPFVLDASTVVLPLAAMIIIGLIGATFSVRRVTSIDPVTALGASR